MKRAYTDEHARAGVAPRCPRSRLAEPIRRLRDRDRHAGIHFRVPQDRPSGFRQHRAAVCPGKRCLELKSYKMYLLAYRNLGIFQENVVNRVLRDVVKAADPITVTVVGDFSPRGGLSSVVTASWSRKRGKR